MIDTLCRRYSCLPDRLFEQDAELIRTVRLVNMYDQPPDTDRAGDW